MLSKLNLFVFVINALNKLYNVTDSFYLLYYPPPLCTKNSYRGVVVVIVW